MALTYAPYTIVMATDRYIDIDGLKVHYEESGAGRPLLLMHGWGCSSRVVASIATVAAQSHHVLNIDMPGFGETPEPPEVWGVEMYTRLVEKIVDKLGLENVSMIGHSFGGRVGILYSSRHSVDKLVLVDAAGIKPRRSLRYYIKVYSFKTAKHIVKALLPKRKAEAVIERMRGRGSSDYAQASSRMRAILSKVVNEDLSDRLSSINAPTLLVWGENDTATPLSDAKKMEKLIPDAGLVSFPGCGHYSFLDNPIQFAAVLKSFLKS